MSNEWNIKIIRKIAGLPLNESWLRDDEGDDDEDPDVRIVKQDKAQSAFEKKNKKELDTAKKEADARKKQPAAKKEEPAKKEQPAPAKQAEEPKKEEPAKGEEAAKRRGRAPSADSKSGHARAWLSQNAGAKRGDFIKHVTTNHGMSKHHANTLFYMLKKKVTEGFILVHPHMPSFVLAENREMNQMQWVDASSPLEPMIFETKEKAEKVVKYMAEWKSQQATIERVVVEELDK